MTPGFRAADLEAAAQLGRGGLIAPPRAGSTRPAPLFFSDWRAGQGTTSFLKRDGNKWAALLDSGSHLAVVAAPGGVSPGFANALRVTRSTSKTAQAWVSVTDLWGLPAVGDSLYFRLYHYFDITTAQLTNDKHPIESQEAGTACTTGYTMNTIPQGGSPAKVEILHQWDQSGLVYFPNRAAAASAGGVTTKFDCGAWYRFEWRLKAMGGGQYEITPRAWDKDGVQVWTAANVRWLGSGYPLMASDPVRPMNESSTTGNIKRLKVGSNGGTWGNAGDMYMYWAGVCVRSDDWCGPYTLADG